MVFDDNYDVPRANETRERTAANEKTTHAQQLPNFKYSTIWFSLAKKKQLKETKVRCSSFDAVSKYTKKSHFDDRFQFTRSRWVHTLDFMMSVTSIKQEKMEKSSDRDF